MNNKKRKIEIQTSHIIKLLLSLTMLLFFFIVLFLPSALNNGHMGTYYKESGDFIVEKIEIKITKKAILFYSTGEYKEVEYHNKIDSDGSTELVYFHMAEYNEPVKFVFLGAGEMVNAKQNNIVFKKQ